MTFYETIVNNLSLVLLSYIFCVPCPR